MMWPGLIFLASYVGVALGRIPGLTLDRTGIALLGAIAMIEVGTMPGWIPVTLASFVVLAVWIRA